MKKLKSNLYIKGKFGKDWVHREVLNTDVEYLYEDGRRKSNIKESDLPENYIRIGKNDGWKNECNIGSRNNQNFIQIPHSRFVDMISYKCEKVGIKVITNKESYP